jgi:hypothetical protein
MNMQITLSIITVIIGGIVAYVGYQQHLVNRERLKLDLFEKRFAVYTGLQNCLANIFQKGVFDSATDIALMLNTHPSVFLFDETITNYIKEVRNRALLLEETVASLDGLPKSDQRSALVKQKYEHLKWLSEQNVKLPGIFSPYLKFRSWK